MKKRNAVFAVAFGLVLATGFSVSAVEEEVATTYKTYVEIEDWGATVTKVLVDAGQTISGEIPADAFEVSVTRYDHRLEVSYLEEGKRRVTDAYVCDENGDKAESGTYIALELAYGPNITLGNALNYANGSNAWIDCEYEIVQEKDIILGEQVLSGLVAEECTEIMKPEVEKFQIGSGTYDDIEFSYAHYEPETNGEKKPLIVWLHGGGEGGGEDATIPISANKAVSFASDEIQEYFGGAYVLVPQCPTFWMEGMDEEGNSVFEQMGMSREDFLAQIGGNGTSLYEEGVFELIEDYVSTHSDIDTNRIYLGGCSNGGYLTMLILRDHPDYFAAGFPVCEVLFDTLITEEDINTYRDQAIWFVLASTDQTADPYKHSIPTYIRLKEAGAENVHMTLYDKVIDTSGLYRQTDDTPYEYNGHWAWTYVYNDQVSARIGEEEVSLLSWLAQQTLN